MVDITIVFMGVINQLIRRSKGPNLVVIYWESNHQGVEYPEYVM